MRPLWVILAGAFLILIICVLGIFLIVSPRTKAIAALETSLKTEQDKAFQPDSRCQECHKDVKHPASAKATNVCSDCHMSEKMQAAGGTWVASGVHVAEQDVRKAEQEERDAKMAYDEIAREKTLPINTGSQVEYVINVWHIYREDFPQLTEQFIADLEKQYEGLEITPKRIDLPAPPMSPPPTTGGFLQLPGFNLSLNGTYDQVKAVLRSLKNFPSGAISFTGISAMSATPDGRIQVSIDCTPYLMVEEPPGAAAAAAPAPSAGGGMMGGGMMGGPMMGGGGRPMMGGGGGPGSPGAGGPPAGAGSGPPAGRGGNSMSAAEGE
jgi:hypothetical protein